MRKPYDDEPFFIPRTEDIRSPSSVTHWVDGDPTTNATKGWRPGIPLLQKVCDNYSKQTLSRIDVSDVTWPNKGQRLNTYNREGWSCETTSKAR